MKGQEVVALLRCAKESVVQIHQSAITHLLDYIQKLEQNQNQEENMRVKMVVLDPICEPKRGTPGAAGLDLVAREDTILCVGVPASVPVGIRLELDPDLEGQIRSRSGLARGGVSVTNSPGTIDSDYRGEVKVLLTLQPRPDTANESHITIESFPIRRGERIAQLVIGRVIRPTIEIATELSATSRGDGGFGSTGR